MGYDRYLHMTMSPPSSDAAQTTAFIARTSGMDTNHTNAFKTLINGLVSDGVFTLLDGLYVFMTNSSANAVLNLCGTAHTLTPVNGPVFTADTGFAGNGTNRILTSDLALQSSTNFSVNSGSIFGWSSETANDNGYICGNDGASNNSVAINSFDFSGDAQVFINSGTAVGGANSGDGSGFYCGSRTDANTVTLYKNGTQLAQSTANAASAISAGNFEVLGSGGLGFWNGGVMACGVGAGLTSTQALALYNRLHAYGQAIAGLI